MMMLYVLLGAMSVGSLMAMMTDPFSRLSIVRRPYVAEMRLNAIEAIDSNARLRVRTGLRYRVFGMAKNAFHILASRYSLRPRTGRGASVDRIIEEIYRLRFDPSKLLLISGDHFSSLFVRNLGVFYYPTLDTQLPATDDQWRDRQLVYLQTLAYALGVFDKTDDLATTIVPIGPWEATCVNFHSYPSDTLYGMLYALGALLGREPARAASYGEEQSVLGTREAAALLLDTYRGALIRHYLGYRRRVFDEDLGLIDPSVTMSGAKDIVKRESSFYDNVVFWKTTHLAMDLGLIPTDLNFLARLKSRILNTFWLDDDGHFLEDLSAEGTSRRLYSSDWLIVLATRFLDPESPDERHYFERSVDYIRAEGIAHPFAIKYQQERRSHRQFAVVRFAVPNYGGDSIWSFWGMEYIKTLLLLFRSTRLEGYLEEADRHIGHFEAAMRRDRGFPEVYDAQGDLLQTPLYRSVRMTGWVIGFDQVRAMRRALAGVSAQRTAA